MFCLSSSGRPVHRLAFLPVLSVLGTWTCLTTEGSLLPSAPRILPRHLPQQMSVCLTLSGVCFLEDPHQHNLTHAPPTFWGGRGKEARSAEQVAGSTMLLCTLELRLRSSPLAQAMLGLQGTGHPNAWTEIGFSWPSAHHSPQRQGTSSNSTAGRASEETLEQGETEARVIRCDGGHQANGPFLRLARGQKQRLPPTPLPWGCLPELWTALRCVGSGSCPRPHAHSHAGCSGPERPPAMAVRALGAGPRAGRVTGWAMVCRC